MNLLSINKNTLDNITNIPNFSQLAILFEDMDSIQSDNKIQTLSLLVEKLRQNGELVIKISDYSKIIDALCHNRLDAETGPGLLHKIKFYTDPMVIINHIVSLEPKIILYKMIEDNYGVILTLKRTEY